jgi:hypothetical protein
MPVSDQLKTNVWKLDWFHGKLVETKQKEQELPEV